MDIDDILAEVGGQTSAPETRDLQALSRAWVIERGAPEILSWPDSLMERILQRISRQVEPKSRSSTASTCTDTLDSGQIEQVELQTGNTDPKTNFCLIILQTELERFKFLVRSFLRTRIVKVTLQINPFPPSKIHDGLSD